MAAAALTERYAANLHGVLSCFDRIIITGTLPGPCYADDMTSYLCAAVGIEFEHVSKSRFRKEDLVTRVLHVLSAMEACPSYKPWH